MELHSLGHFAFVAIATLGGTALVACSHSNGSGGSPIPFSQFGQQAFAQLCPAIAPCCKTNGFDDPNKKCTDAAAGLQAEFEKTKGKHPDYVWDEARAGNCIAKLVAAYSTCNFRDQEPSFDATADCDALFVGTKKIGETCSDSDDCARPPGMTVHCVGASASASSDGTTTTTGGKCIQFKAPADGDDCIPASGGVGDPSKTYGDCNTSRSANLFCQPDEKKCRAKGGDGASCEFKVASGTTTDSLACKKGFVCDYTSKTCKTAPKVGESCTESFTCADGAYCNSASRKCEAELEPGADCSTTNAQCAHGCDKQTKKCRTNDVARELCTGVFDD